MSSTGRSSLSPVPGATGRVMSMHRPGTMYTTAGPLTQSVRSHSLAYLSAPPSFRQPHQHNSSQRMAHEGGGINPFTLVLPETASLRPPGKKSLTFQRISQSQEGRVAASSVSASAAPTLGHAQILSYMDHGPEHNTLTVPDLTHVLAEQPEVLQANENTMEQHIPERSTSPPAYSEYMCSPVTSPLVLPELLSVEGVATLCVPQSGHEQTPPVDSNHGAELASIYEQEGSINMGDNVTREMGFGLDVPPPVERQHPQ
uniref:Uncharacterized protein n=1 Tax=Mycena chlorophos TaxID=658473 RepID=A0ABQ0LMX2_MYCCL|nr:predicted protein [Mycena chlorophos]